MTVTLAGGGIAACGSSSSASTKSGACPNNPVRFAVEPYDSAANLTKAYQSISNKISTKLGCKVQLIVSDSYVAEINAMKAGKIEMGEFGPLGYVLAHQIANAQPVAVFGDKNGKPDMYTAGLWTAKSSPIKSLKGISSKTVGLSSATSTSGGLYPLSALIKAGYKCTAANLTCAGGPKVVQTGGHPASVLALTHGKVDLAEVNSQAESTAIASHTFNPKDYREVWKSTKIVNDPICVRGDLSQAFRAKLTKVLLSLSAADLKSADSELGTNNTGKLVPATDALYNQVRGVAKSVNLTTAELG
ncbi:MAG: phosphate/phosphite/phosphonate ABC transporter substrate-binding protein [Solirubrobacterales bacterium]|nr:phosphate/phosphite/phosphonate ABC transporter substrate-binding protein [Solirubrobacterales bacterium]